MKLFVEINKVIAPRELSEDEQQIIESNIIRFAKLRDSAKALQIKTENIKSGLELFVKDETIYKNLHPICQTEIVSSLCAMGLPHYPTNIETNRPDAFKAAALLSLSKLNGGKGGRPIVGYRIELARYIVQLYRSLGRRDMARSVGSKLFNFAEIIFDEVEPNDPIPHSTITKLLREVMSQPASLMG